MNFRSLALRTGVGIGGATVTGGGAVTVGAAGAAATAEDAGGGEGIGCGSVVSEWCQPKSVDTSRTRAAMTATTSTQRPADISRPCRLAGDVVAVVRPWPPSVVK